MRWRELGAGMWVGGAQDTHGAQIGRVNGQVWPARAVRGWAGQGALRRGGEGAGRGSQCPARTGQRRNSRGKVTQGEVIELVRSRGGQGVLRYVLGGVIHDDASHTFYAVLSCVSGL